MPPPALPDPPGRTMFLALLGAVAIGIVLGLLGSGGSILTVPVLVYLAGQPDKVAIAESLAIVGAIAAVGAVPYARQKLVDWHSVLYFGVPGIIGTYGGAALAKWVPGAVQLALFAVVMILAAGLMFRGRKEVAQDEVHARQPLWLIAAEGLVVGVLTGLVGVGGGFLIVPALVLLGGLSMRVAVGTSLLIIAAKSAAGFLKYTDVLAETGLHVDWQLIGIFAAIGIVGSFVGNALSQKVPQAQLKRGFAVFLVIMGGFILVKEGPRALGAPDAQAATLSQPAPVDASSVTDSTITSLPAFSDDRFVSAPLFQGEGFRLVGFAFREGQALPSHSAEVDAYFLVTEGRALVTVGEAVVELGAGDGVTLPATVPHAVEALADTRAMLSR